MEKPLLDEGLLKLYEGHEMVDMPVSATLDNADEYYCENEYMTLDVLMVRLSKLI